MGRFSLLCEYIIVVLLSTTLQSESGKNKTALVVHNEESSVLIDAVKDALEEQNILYEIIQEELDNVCYMSLQNSDSHLFVVSIYKIDNYELKPCRYNTSENKAPILGISKFLINNNYTREPVKDFNNQLYHVTTIYSTLGTISTYTAGEPLKTAQDQLFRHIALVKHVSSFGFPKFWKIKEVSIKEQDIKSELDRMSEDIIMTKQEEWNDNGSLNTNARIWLYCYVPALAGILIVSFSVLIIDSVPAKGRQKSYDITTTEHKN